MEINITIDKEFKRRITKLFLRDLAECVLRDEKTIKNVNVELGVLITNQEKIRELNRTYRGKDRPTDVLSFYMIPEDENDKIAFIAPPDNVHHLGEVIISYPQAVIQAKQRKYPVNKEITILLIHGILHLLGYDHEKPEDEKRMRKREEGLLEKLT